MTHSNIRLQSLMTHSISGLQSARTLLNFNIQSKIWMDLRERKIFDQNVPKYPCSWSAYKWSQIIFVYALIVLSHPSVHAGGGACESLFSLPYKTVSSSDDQAIRRSEDISLTRNNESSQYNSTQKEFKHDMIEWLMQLRRDSENLTEKHSEEAIKIVQKLPVDAGDLAARFVGEAHIILAEKKKVNQEFNYNQLMGSLLLELTRFNPILSFSEQGKDTIEGFFTRLDPKFRQYLGWIAHDNVQLHYFGKGRLIIDIIWQPEGFIRSVTLSIELILKLTNPFSTHPRLAEIALKNNLLKTLSKIEVKDIDLAMSVTAKDLRAQSYSYVISALRHFFVLILQEEFQKAGFSRHKIQTQRINGSRVEDYGQMNAFRLSHSTPKLPEWIDAERFLSHIYDYINDFTFLQGEQP